MLYCNISPFCEPLSFDYKFQLDLFLCFAIRIFRVLYELLHCIFVQVSTVFYTNFLLSFVTNRLPYILHCFIFVYEFLLLISIRIFCVSYEFSSLFFATNRLPYIFHCFPFVYELLHEFESCTLETMNLIVIFEFQCNTHLTMSLIVFL